MTTTTNYGYTVVVGSDTPVNIQNDIAPNFTAIDTDLKAVSDSSITIATHTVAGTVHQLVRADADRNVLYFVATGDMALGDTFTVDGVSVTARLVNGEALGTGSFKINNNVFGILVGTVLNLMVPGAFASASDTTYDNTGSGLAATDVQNAIDEVNAQVETNTTAISGLSTCVKMKNKTGNTLGGLIGDLALLSDDEKNSCDIEVTTSEYGKLILRRVIPTLFNSLNFGGSSMACFVLDTSSTSLYARTVAYNGNTYSDVPLTLTDYKITYFA